MADPTPGLQHSPDILFYCKLAKYRRFLRKRVALVGCPKLDDAGTYVELQGTAEGMAFTRADLDLLVDGRYRFDHRRV